MQPASAPAVDLPKNIYSIQLCVLHVYIQNFSNQDLIYARWSQLVVVVSKNNSKVRRIDILIEIFVKSLNIITFNSR